MCDDSLFLLMLSTLAISMQQFHEIWSTSVLAHFFNVIQIDIDNNNATFCNVALLALQAATVHSSLLDNWLVHLQCQVS